MKEQNFKAKIQQVAASEDQIKSKPEDDNADSKRSLLKKRRRLAREAREDPKFAEFLASRNEEHKDLLQGIKMIRNKKTGKLEITWENDESDSSEGNSSGIKFHTPPMKTSLNS